jgi:hypothetical protein
VGGFLNSEHLGMGGSTAQLLHSIATTADDFSGHGNYGTDRHLIVLCSLSSEQQRFNHQLIYILRSKGCLQR